MKKSVALGALLASASPIALLIGGPATAADLALKTPRPMYAPPPPAFSWTGCYVGAHVGWGWGRNNFSESSSSTTTVVTVSSAGTGSTTSSSFRSASSRIDSSGGLFGGQVGCNYQFGSGWAGSNWVVGIQGDFAGTDINGTANDPLGPSASGAGGAIRLKTEWLASVTARLGVTAFDNQALFYIKGGGAWDRNKWDLSSAANAFNPAVFSETRSGWTIGGGAEWVLWSPRWTAFVEFNYYDFRHGGSSVTGNSTSTSTGVGFSGTAPIITTTTTTTHNIFSTGSQQIETVKVGVNYKFGP